MRRIVFSACYPRKTLKGRYSKMSEKNLDIQNEEEFDEEELENLVYLSDEDGNEVAFEYLDSVEYKGDEYVVLISTDEDDDEVVILKVEPTPDDEEEEDFVTVESEAVAQAVFDIFKERNKDYFNFAE